MYYSAEGVAGVVRAEDLQRLGKGHDLLAAVIIAVVVIIIIIAII